MGVFLDDDDPANVEIPVPVNMVPHHALDLSNDTISDILTDINAAAAMIPEDKDGAIVGSYTRDRWFGAVIVKAPGGWNIKGFVGQEDGKKLDYGIGVLKTFKF